MESLALDHDAVTVILSFLHVRDQFCIGLVCSNWYSAFTQFISRSTKRFKRVRFIVIGNHTNRRVTFFTTAVDTYSQKYGIPSAKVIDWETMLDSIHVSSALSDVKWDEIFDDDPHTMHIVRLDSPGESWEVEKKIIGEGADPMYRTEARGMRIRAEDVQQLQFDKGIIHYQRQWYLGFEHVITLIAQRLESIAESPSRSPVKYRFMNDPREIMIMFDKRQCHALLKQHNIPVPRAAYDVTDYDELRTVMRENDLDKAFVKLAHGSSASGVVAYACIPDAHKYTQFPFTEVATTSAELVKDPVNGSATLYNSLRIRKYTKNNDIRLVIDQLCAEKVIVEEWLPKAKHQNASFDLRIMVINGIVQHFVVRTSLSPMTNLHLGNKRGDSQLFLQEILAKAPQTWRAVKETCEKLARDVFPRSMYMGVDMLLTPGYKEHYVLEVNAFGDLIPNVLHKDMDTYHSEVYESINKYMNT
jgi:glutathione synthase/RimK-type ligase-like ATP-grasp enzyme